MYINAPVRLERDDNTKPAIYEIHRRPKVGPRWQKIQGQGAKIGYELHKRK